MPQGFNPQENGHYDRHDALRRAKLAARDIKENLTQGRVPLVALILGTGWGSALPLKNTRERPLAKLEGAEKLPQLDGHDRLVVAGDLCGLSVIALRGRVHLNEHPDDARILIMTRLQIQMLCELGVLWIILTNAAGSLHDNIEVGNIVMATGFMSLFAPPMPLFAGEFSSPDSVLCSNMRLMAQQAQEMDGIDLELNVGTYAMLRGPQFEGPCDKKVLKALGAAVVGMSTYPEACVIAAHKGDTPRVLALSYVTNTAFEKHSHETNLARAKAKSPLLGALLTGIVRRIGEYEEEEAAG